MRPPSTPSNQAFHFVLFLSAEFAAGFKQIEAVPLGAPSGGLFLAALVSFGQDNALEGRDHKSQMRMHANA